MIGSNLFILAAAYLLGSIPFAYIVTRQLIGLDIREVGEGNVGARNVWHVVGPAWGTLVGALDVSKGFLAFQVAEYLGASEGVLLVAGFALVLGHGFPIFLRGKGGKGVAVIIGFLLGLLPASTLAGLVIFGLAHLALRDFNRSVNIGVAAIILLPLAFGQPPWIALYILSLFLWMGVKKILDLPHERKVWARSGWKGGAKPGWYRPPSEDKVYRNNHAHP